jgi:hypothetical protein
MRKCVQASFVNPGGRGWFNKTFCENIFKIITSVPGNKLFAFCAEGGFKTKLTLFVQGCRDYTVWVDLDWME